MKTLLILLRRVLVGLVLVTSFHPDVVQAAQKSVTASSLEDKSKFRKLSELELKDIKQLEELGPKKGTGNLGDYFARTQVSQKTSTEILRMEMKDVVEVELTEAEQLSLERAITNRFLLSVSMMATNYNLLFRSYGVGRCGDITIVALRFGPAPNKEDRFYYAVRGGSSEWCFYVVERPSRWFQDESKFRRLSDSELEKIKRELMDFEMDGGPHGSQEILSEFMRSKPIDIIDAKLPDLERLSLEQAIAKKLLGATLLDESLGLRSDFRSYCIGKFGDITIVALRFGHLPNTEQNYSYGIQRGSSEWSFFESYLSHPDIRPDSTNSQKAVSPGK